MDEETEVTPLWYTHPYLSQGYGVWYRRNNSMAGTNMGQLTISTHQYSKAWYTIMMFATYYLKPCGIYYFRQIPRSNGNEFESPVYIREMLGE